MADVHSPEVRSFNMSRIRGKDTRPEEITRKYLFSQGFRYRKNVNSLPGRPDIVLPKYKACVFVNGCFWHKHEGCKYFVWPKSNTEFWREKLERNVQRDNLNHNKLIRMGWRVFVVWECQLRKNTAENTLTDLATQIRENDLQR